MLITVLSAGSVDARCCPLPSSEIGEDDMTSIPDTAQLSQRRAKTVPDRVVFGGVETHKELHVAAVIDAGETVFGTRSFSTTRAGYRVAGLGGRVRAGGAHRC